MNTETAVTELEKGNQLLEEGKLEEAIAAYRRAIELNPDISWSHHNLGEALAKLGQFQEAIAAYRRAIELNPDFSWSYHHLGDILDRQQQWEEAVVAFSRAIELNPEHFGSYCGLGQSLVNLGQLDEAIVAYRRASELEPATDWIQYRLGEVLQQRTEVDWEGEIASYHPAVELNPDDVQVYRKLLEIQPDNLEVYLQLGNAFVKQGNLEEAIALYHKAIELKPQEALIHHLLGEALEELGHLEQAVASYRRGIELHPYFVSDEQLGKALAKLSYLEQFPPDDAAFLQQTCQLNDADFVRELFRIYLKRYLNDEGIAGFLDIIHSSGRSREQAIAEIVRPSIEFQSQYKKFFTASIEEVHWRLGTFFAQKGKWDEAIGSFHQALVLKPDIASAYSHWAKNLALKNKHDAQVTLRATFLNALLKKSYSAEFYACLGQLLALTSQTGDAVQAYQKSLLIQPDSPDSGKIYVALGKLQQQQNKIEEALQCYQRAINIDPQQAQIYIYIGHFLSEQKQFYAALKFYNKSLECQPEQGEVYIYIGHCFSILNQKDEAIKYYLKAIAQPNIHHHAYIALANCLAEQKRFDEAVFYLEQLLDIELPGTYVDTIKTLGNIRIQQGKVEEANACFQKIQPITTPQGYCVSTQEWVTESKWNATKYIDIHPSHQVKINAPKTIDTDVHPVLKNWTKFDSPATFVATVPEGRYCQLDERKTAYIAPENQVLLDVSSFICPETMSEINLFPIHEIDGTVAVLAGNTSAIYYHWILDTLPRLGLIELSGIELESIDKFVVRSYEAPFHKETLSMLGIPEHKIIESRKYPHVKADRLIVSSYPGIICCPTKWAVDFLRRKFLPATAISKSEQPERIYISRNLAPTRRIINEDEVLEVLNKLGFVTINAESISLAETGSLLRGAKVVVSMHGGGETNLIFCSPGTKVIEIFTPHHMAICYYILSHQLELDYYYLIGDSIECSYLRQLIYQIDGFEDTFVNIDSLKALLKMAGVT